MLESYRNSFRISLFVVLNLFILNFEAQGSYTFKSNGRPSQWLNNGFEYFVDSNNAFDYSQNQTIPYQSHLSSSLNLSACPYPVWVRLSFKNESDDPLYLVIDYPLIDTLELWIKNAENELIAQYTTGSHFLFESRPIYDNLFRFKLPEGNSQVVLRAKSPLNLQIPLKVVNQKGVNHELHNRDVWQNAYIGLVLLAIIGSFILGLFTKTLSFYAYIGHLIAQAFITLHLGGYAFMYLWPEYPIINRFEPLIFGLGIFSTLFSMEFLNTRERAPIFHKLLWISLGFNLLVFPISLSGYNFIANQLVQIVGMLGCLLMLVAGLKIWLSGYRPARFFVLAWSVFLVGVIITILQRVNVLPFNDFTLHASQIGNAIDILLFFMAMADKVLFMQDERDEATRKMLETAQENARLTREQNITLSKKVNQRTQKLKSQKEELEKLYTEQSRLLTIIGHDLKGPIGSLGQALELMQNDPSLRTEDFITMLKSSTNSTYGLLENLLNYARAKQGNISKEITEVQIRPLFQSLRNLFAPALERKEIAMLLSAEKNLVLTTDKGILSIILRNFISNALKFSQPKSTIEAYAHKMERKVILGIKDEGVGMSKEQLRRILNFDQNISTKGTAGEEGTGLGLKVALEYAKALGFTYNLTSAPNKGTQIELTLFEKTKSKTPTF